MHQEIHALQALALLFAPADAEFAAQQADRDVLQAIELVRPHDLSAELDELERGGIALTAEFRLRESGVPGEIRLELSNGVAEAQYFVDGVSHVRVRHVDGGEDSDRRHRL